MSRWMIPILLLSGLMAGSAWAQTFKATIIWKPGPFATEHRVERKINTGAYEPLAIVVMPETTYLDLNLPAGQTYCYRVIAANETGAAMPTPERCGMPLQIPDPATGLQLFFEKMPSP